MADSQRMKQASVQPLLLLGDLGCLLIAFSLSVYLRANLSINNQVAVGLEIPIWVYLAIPVLWILAAVPLGLYRPRASSKKHSLFLLPALNILVNAVSIFTLSIFLMPVVPRLIYPLYILLSISMLLAFRLALRHFLASGLQARLTITTLAIWRKVTFIDNLLYERRADLIAVALASALWVFLNYRAGFAYTPDSVEYITMASKLRFSGQAAFLPYWPPLFPLLITLLTFLTPYPANAAMLLVSASTVGVLIVYAVLVRRIFHSSLLALVTVLILAGMGIFLNVATTAWSEMTFLLFLLLSMVFILKFSESYDSRAVYLALLFAGLAALTRYIGSAQLVIATVLIVWISRRAGKRAPIWPILVCNSFFITTLGLWTLRNKAIFGENWFDVWMGPRGSMVKDLPINLATTAQILGKDLSWPLIALVVVSLIYFASQIRRIQMNNMMVNSFVIFAVPVGYLIALIYSSSIYTPVLLDSRLLFPAYASLIVFAVAGGKEAIHAAWQAKNQFIRYFVPFFAVFLIGFSFVNNSRWILNQVNETIRHAGQANLHFYAGYGLSSTSERLARILAENLAASESLDIFVLVTPETQGRIFLLQKDVYKGLDVSSVRYSYGHGDDYSVMLHTKNGQDIRINYWFTSASESFYTLEPQDPQLLISQISQKIPRTSTAFLLVFLLNEQNAVAWQTILDAFSDQYTSIVYEVAPYEVAAFSHMELGN